MIASVRLDLEIEALKLAVAECDRLAEALLESLESLSNDENRALWLEEAARRDLAIDRNPTLARPAEDVFHEARARLR